MKVVFNGTLEKTQSGCSRCGTLRKGGISFVRTKDYILPSGIVKTFRMGVPEEVDEADGRFLLSYQYEDENGDFRRIFEECDG